MEKAENNLYSLLTETEKQNIHDNAHRLAGLLSIWSSCYKIIRPPRIEPVAVLIATVLPEFSLQQSLLVGKLILYIFAVDDVADERLISYNEFRRLRLVWEQIALTGWADTDAENDDLSAILREIYTELSQYTHFSTLNRLWANRLNGLTEAMSLEYADGLRFSVDGKETLPPLDEYIEGGIHSVGFPFWGTSILILLSEPAILQQLDPINEIIRNTGAAIRLYNDLRTLQKEIQEMNFNSVLILQNTLQVKNPELASEPALQQSKDIILGLANHYAEKSIGLVNHIQTNSGQLECMIQRIIAFHAYFYGSRQHDMDYHTVSQSDSYSLIQKG